MPSLELGSGPRISRESAIPCYPQRSGFRAAACHRMGSIEDLSVPGVATAVTSQTVDRPEPFRARGAVPSCVGLAALSAEIGLPRRLFIARNEREWARPDETEPATPLAPTPRPLKAPCR
jgi:hypothetical protein